MQTGKDIRLDILTDDAKKELLEFYDHLLSKYGKNKVETKEKKRLFMEAVDRHSFNLPSDYRFDRDDIHGR